MTIEVETINKDKQRVNQYVPVDKITRFRRWVLSGIDEELTSIYMGKDDFVVIVMDVKEFNNIFKSEKQKIWESSLKTV